METIDVLFGLMRFTPALLAVDFGFLLMIIWGWYLRYKRTGWMITYWDFKIFLIVLLPIVIQYPFAGSYLQVGAVGNDIDGVSQRVDLAFSISALGIASVYFGAILYNTFGKSLPIVNTPLLVMKPWEGIVRYNLNRRNILFPLVLLAVPFTPFLIQTILSLENPFTIRDSFLVNKSERPIFNAAMAVFPIIPLFAIIKFSDTGRRQYLFAFIAFSAILLLFGSRSTLFLTLVNNVVLFTLSRRGRFSRFKALLFVLFVLAGIIALGAAREGGNPGLAVFKFGYGMFYGNNFSDLRDFAWILSKWDGNYLLGKTEAASLISFIPTSLSDFRQQWTAGAYTATLIGFSTEQQAGVRVGLFGETFLNFGYGGVVLAGILWGYALKHADVQIRRGVEQGLGIRFGFASTLPFYLVNSMLATTGFWGFYIFLGVNMILLIVLALFQRKPIRQNHCRLSPNAPV